MSNLTVSSQSGSVVPTEQSGGLSVAPAVWEFSSEFSTEFLTLEAIGG